MFVCLSLWYRIHRGHLTCVECLWPVSASTVPGRKGQKSTGICRGVASKGTITGTGSRATSLCCNEHPLTPFPIQKAPLSAPTLPAPLRRTIGCPSGKPSLSSSHMQVTAIQQEVNNSGEGARDIDRLWSGATVCAGSRLGYLRSVSRQSCSLRRPASPTFRRGSVTSERVRLTTTRAVQPGGSSTRDSRWYADNCRPLVSPESRSAVVASHRDEINVASCLGSKPRQSHAKGTASRASTPIPTYFSSSETPTPISWRIPQ